MELASSLNFSVGPMPVRTSFSPIVQCVIMSIGKNEAGV